MKRMFSSSWLLGLTWLLLSVGSAHADFCQKNLPPSNPDAVYTDHDDGTVTDMRTGLMWKQCAEGLSGATCGTGSPELFNWAEALRHAEASTFADYSDWRLPNAKELSGLVEECRAAPAINTTHFPNTPSSNFWSGSPLVYGDGAWYVSFYYGYALNYVQRVYSQVRLVRGGQ